MEQDDVAVVAVVAVALVAAAVVVARRRRMSSAEGFAPQDGVDAGKRPMDSIFVSVASYRDRDCAGTLRSMYANASRPDLVFAGVVEQNSNDVTESCAYGEKLPEQHARNVTTLVVPHTDAKGPTYARYLCSTLFAGEEYFLQIDSHTSFERGWDDKLRRAYGEALTRSRQPILSTYPHAHDSDDKGTPVLCKSSFNHEGVPTWEAVIMDDGEGRPTPFTSGGFLFSSGKLLDIVPYDPSLAYLFAGEEALYSARAWTHGFDIFTPPSGILKHVYGRGEAPRFWTDRSHNYKKIQAETLKKVRRLLGLQGPPMPDDYGHGMGKVRSVKEWFDFAGLDAKSKSSTSMQKFCSKKN